jgi:nucleoside-diphosphate-sugar epimerase
VTTLVTGAGLIGTHVAQRLQQNGESPVILDVDIDENRVARKLQLDAVTLVRAHLGDLPTLLRLIREHAITRVIHTASLTSLTWTQPYRGVTENVGALLNLLEAARLEGLGKIVFVSSSSVYGQAARGRADKLNEELTPIPVDVYGTTKLINELLGTIYGRDHGFQFTSVRFPLVVPPVEAEFQRIPHTVVTRVGSVIPNMVQAAVVGTHFSADDWAPLDWIYAPDAAAGAVRAAELNAPTGTFNMTAGDPLTLAQVAEAITQHVPGAALDIRAAAGGSVMQRVLGSGADDTREPLLDGSKAATQLGFRCQYGVAEMIAHMFADARETCGAQ